jgi:hypothetical protein
MRKRTRIPPWIRFVVRLGAAYLMLVGLADILGLEDESRSNRFDRCMIGALTNRDRLTCYELYGGNRYPD